MIFFVIALISAVIGSMPLWIRTKVFPAISCASAYSLLGWLIFYFDKTNMTGPLLGSAGVITLIWLTISAIIDAFIDENPTHTAWLPLATSILFGGIAINSCDGFHAQHYANLIGEIEQREWTTDIQPKDPRHVRLVPKEHALYLANNQLGSAAGAMGSQFELATAYTTLQLVKNDLVWVIPFDYAGWGAYNNTEGCPGYVIVDAEDPATPVKVHLGEKYTHTPGAYFGNNLERYLKSNGYLTSGLTDYSFELDENDQAWWVVSVFEYSKGWEGPTIRGIIKVSPTTGEMVFETLGQIEEWIDRAIPVDTLKYWIKDWGLLRNGWQNAHGWAGIGPAAKKDCMKAEEPTFNYGSNGEPYLVTCLTSINDKDTSMVGLLYTNVRTGKTIFYHTKGNTEEAILHAVNAQVSYKKWHGTDPVIYNIYGRMTAIVPILSEKGIWQGVAFGDLETSKVAVGETLHDAIREYQKVIAETNKTDAPEAEKTTGQITGTIERFGYETGTDSTTYTIVLKGVPKIFTCSSGNYTKIPATQKGDTVVITYIDAQSDTLPILGFDNLSLPLQSSSLQEDVRQQGVERRAEATKKAAERDIENQIKNLSPKELKELLELRKNSNKN